MLFHCRDFVQPKWWTTKANGNIIHLDFSLSTWLLYVHRIAGKPEKPPNSAYSLFSRLMLQGKDENHIEGEPKNRMKEIANKWKEVPDEQKKAYADDVKHVSVILFLIH